tara:strand:+ start:115 stop:507 length:393 start_codon:yes stop_codon:yes gene_type:complete
MKKIFDILYFVVAWGIIIALIYYFRENIILFLLGASLLVIGILLFLIVGVLYTIPLGYINEKVKNEKKKSIFLIIWWLSIYLPLFLLSKSINEFDFQETFIPELILAYYIMTFLLSFIYIPKFINAFKKK